MKIFLNLLLLLFSVFTFAKTDRVLEVENQIKRDAVEHISKFIPRKKFLVEVDVKPLKRRSTLAQNSKLLPFVDIDQKQFIDEWEDPEVNTFTLYSRIREASIKVLIDSSVTLNNKRDFKNALLREVNLIPARDNVLFEELNPGFIETDFNFKEYKFEIIATVAVGLFFFFGLAIFDLFKKLVLKIGGDDQKANAVNGGSASGRDVLPTTLSSPESNDKTAGGVSLGGLDGSSLIFNDQGKLEQRIMEKLNFLLDKEDFPSVKDLTAFENLAEKNLSSFGYLVSCLGVEKQKTIYRYGRSDQWFEGFTLIGKPSLEVLSFLEEVLHDRASMKNRIINDCLVSLWRLEEKAVEVLRGYDEEVVFSLLRLLPKNQSIPLARDLFPGSWGHIFQSNGSETSFNVEAAKKIMDAALKAKPLLSFTALLEFKDRKDLIKYLDTVSPKEEKEIYTVLGESSQLHNIRPPFFKIFESKEILQSFYKNYTVKDWALACVDVGYDTRKVLVDLFEEKESYFFSTYIKEYSSDLRYKREINSMRRKMAKAFSETKQLEDVTSSEKSLNTNTGEGEVDEQNVA